MPLIRTRQDIDNHLGGPTPAEEKLLAACLAGEACILGEEVPPEGKARPGVEIRADVLRYLITGGCDTHPTADWGVGLIGAHITGALDLSLATATGLTGLISCRFDNVIQALQARLQTLSLNRSTFPGMFAQGAQVTGDVFLLGVGTIGEVGLSGAIIGGQLDFNGAKFTATDGNALNAEGAQVTGNVFLRNVEATGEVKLSGANIGGQLSCTGAQFNATDGTALKAEGAQVTESVFLRDIETTGEVSLSGATIGGQLSCEGAKFNATDGFAVNAQRLNVTDGLFFQRVTCGSGTINLNNAATGDLEDDPQSWPPQGRLILDGLTYERVNDDRFPRLSDRLDWLAKGSTYDGGFYPQPYTQLAKVYRETGHDRDAATVLFHREKHRRAHQRADYANLANGDVGVPLARLWRFIVARFRQLWDLTLRFTVGYGYKPVRSLWVLIGLSVISIWLAHMAWEEGSMAPNSDVILTSPEWIAVAQTAENPAQVWSDRTGAGRDWQTFNRYAYAADLVIPIIDLGQTDAWAPSTNRAVWGARLWRYGFLLSVAGWLVTALGAAAITGIIRRE